MIIFNSISWKNFLSTGDQETEIQLDKSQSTLIQGPNGAGKSTLLDALCFVLFNKPFRKINKPQLVNSINEKDTVVKIKFTIGKTVWEVIRGIKPNKFEIYRNDKLVDQVASAADQQKWLESNVLKMNYKSFTQVVILGSSTFVPFMQLTPASRREVIEDILDIEIFSTMNLLLKDRVRQVNEQAQECKYELKSAEDKVNIQRQHIHDATASNVEIVETKQLQLAKVEEEIFAINKEIETLKTSNESLSFDDNALKSLREQFVKLDGLKHKITHNKNTVDKELKFFDDHDVCPTCSQRIGSKFKQHKVDRLKEKTEQYAGGLNEMQIKLQNMNASLDLMMATKDEIRSNVSEIKSLEKQSAMKSELSLTLLAEITKLTEAPDIAKMQGKLDAYEEVYKETQSRCADVSRRKTEYEVASYFLKDGGVKAQIIKKYVPVINNKINRHLSNMDFYVNFTLDEEFNEIIKSRYRDEFSYASFSEGEKQKIDLALLFTWREIARMKSSVNTNLLILDEVFDSSLDSNGTEELMKILKGLDGQTNTFVISHKGEILVDRFLNNIKFEKISDFSKMVEYD